MAPNPIDPEVTFPPKSDLQPKSLFDPNLEKSACGVGFIVDIERPPSNKVLKHASTMSARMQHRGACSCDNLTGDGAGILVSPLPTSVFAKRMPNLPSSYASGLLFLDESSQQEAKQGLTEVANKYGLHIMGFTTVPHDTSCLGSVAISSMPLLSQVFVHLKEGDIPHPEWDLEQRCFFVRKTVSHQFLKQNIRFYCPSLSSRTFVFKGHFTPSQLWDFYLDLKDPDMTASLAIVHARFSTNTFPNWDRAQPMRMVAHNGEINTLRGNVNAMQGREGTMSSPVFKEELKSLYPVIEPNYSDSGALDNALEFMVRAGSDRNLPEAMVNLVPESIGQGEDTKNDYYSWTSLRVEPWDGPALFTFTDGRYIGAILDRNGLRPSRYVQTNDGLVILASEAGVVDILDDVSSGDHSFQDSADEPGIACSRVNHLGRLRPGRILLVDLEQKILIRDQDAKKVIINKRDYSEVIRNEIFSLPSVSKEMDAPLVDPKEDPRLTTFSYTAETMDMLLAPMCDPEIHKEALGSMGNDAALAALSTFQPLVYDYFKQVFAQVTNPPIDPFREKIVMSLICPVGPEPNLLDPKEVGCRLMLQHPIISNQHMKMMLSGGELGPKKWKTHLINGVFIDDLESALKLLATEAVQAVSSGIQVLVISDKFDHETEAPIPSLLALGTIHHALISARLRTKVALFVQTGDAREIHHLALLLAYGADGINPYLVFETMAYRMESDTYTVCSTYQQAVSTGILKVMAKMGISTLQSYKGAQIFEAVGLDNSVIDLSFKNTASRVGGADFNTISNEVMGRKALAYTMTKDALILRNPGILHWRAGGEAHINEPTVVATLQDASRNNSPAAFKTYSQWSRDCVKKTTLRGQLSLVEGVYEAIPVESVTDSAADIMKRFCTGAMSFGSISLEAHESLAKAMNVIGGKSNTGEGGESEERYKNPATRSRIKQVASGRFGVTAAYLANADEIQIKMAQGAKPGEGGELPGHKVTAEIAFTRKSVQGVGLISPPPHHDIYSIEDLSQLIYDLKCANPSARISVKLVSVVGVGIVAAGVAKGKAEHITISGHDGGTGASSWTGIKGAGVPWELGLAETHQVLVANDLRSRVTLQVDGQLRSAFDVIVGACLGADEFAFSTAPLIVLGCTMMRKCHLNTCPVGVATQDPELRKKFNGAPEHVVNFFHLLAEDIRCEMAALGVKRFDDLIGRTNLLKFDPSNEKAAKLDMSAILCSSDSLPRSPSTNAAIAAPQVQDFGLEKRKDNGLIAEAKIAGILGPVNATGKQITINVPIKNIDRCFATTLSYECVKQYGEQGLTSGNGIHLRLKGSAGQSLGAWLCHGIKITLEGESNDYVGKGLSGGVISVFPPKLLTDQEIDGHWFRSENNVIAGNVCLYGAVYGKAFLRGLVGERFAVRNSGAIAVAEGCGDHGCEYMTGGKVVILGDTGRNFGAGMSGGIAYVYTFPPYNLVRDRGDDLLKDQVDQFNKGEGGEALAQTLELKFKQIFVNKINSETIDLFSIHDGQLVSGDGKGGVLEGEEQELQQLLMEFVQETGSLLGQSLLDKWPIARRFFLKVFPKEYQRVVTGKKVAEVVAQVQIIEPKKETATDIEDMMSKKKPTTDKMRGFMKYNRIKGYYRTADKRIKDWNEVYDIPKIQTEVNTQSARCMDCGVPFCQSDTGCPLGNMIPTFNELVHKDQWKEAVHTLLQTNNFPEFTGRVCPAPCEGACVLGINADPVAIKSIELSISEVGFGDDQFIPNLLQEQYKTIVRTGKTVAVIGAGPAGLACAAQLSLAGHQVTVYDRQPLAGGLLQYGIPSMKLDKSVIERRINLMRDVQGIQFVLNADVGSDSFPVSKVTSTHDLIALCLGATWPRNLSIPGREASGIYYAMEYLGNERVGNLRDSNKRINANGKKVLVIGGGDTGCDCIGTALREGASSVVAFEILPPPPPKRADDSNPWPQWPKVFRVDYGHEEVKLRSGNDPRLFNISAKEFIVDAATNAVTGIKAQYVDWAQKPDGGWNMISLPEEHVFEADLVFIAMGFMGPEKYLANSLGLELDGRSNVIVTSKQSHSWLDKSAAPYFVKDGVFAGGDCRKGQSLVVHAINEGRQTARCIDLYLKKDTPQVKSSGGTCCRSASQLPASGGIILPSMVSAKQ